MVLHPEFQAELRASDKVVCVYAGLTHVPSLLFVPGSMPRSCSRLQVSVQKPLCYQQS